MDELRVFQGIKRNPSTEGTQKMGSNNPEVAEIPNNTVDKPDLRPSITGVMLLTKSEKENTEEGLDIAGDDTNIVSETTSKIGQVDSLIPALVPVESIAHKTEDEEGNRKAAAKIQESELSNRKRPFPNDLWDLRNMMPVFEPMICLLALLLITKIFSYKMFGDFALAATILFSYLGIHHVFRNNSSAPRFGRIAGFLVLAVGARDIIHTDVSMLKLWLYQSPWFWMPFLPLCVLTIPLAAEIVFQYIGNLWSLLRGPNSKQVRKSVIPSPPDYEQRLTVTIGEVHDPKTGERIAHPKICNLVKQYFYLNHALEVQGVTPRFVICSDNKMKLTKYDEEISNGKAAFKITRPDNCDAVDRYYRNKLNGDQNNDDSNELMVPISAFNISTHYMNFSAAF